MTPYIRVQLSHATLNRPVFLLLGTISGFHWSEATKSTHVYTTGGVFPVSESPEQLEEKIDLLTNPKGGNNGEQ